MHFSTTHQIIVNSETTVSLKAYSPFDCAPYLSSLTLNERNRYEGINNETKKNEFIVSRLLKAELFPNQDIHYSSIGAPYIPSTNSPFISLSHTTGMVGIAVSKFPVGLDLEPIRDLAHRLRFKFLNESEMEILDTSSHAEMTQAWSAKESLYKLANRNKILFQSEINIVKKVDKNHWLCQILKEDGWYEYDMRFFISEGNILSINEGLGRLIAHCEL